MICTVRTIRKSEGFVKIGLNIKSEDKPLWVSIKGAATSAKTTDRNYEWTINTARPNSQV